MGREIKFRVWDEAERRMMSWEEVDEHDKMGVYQFLDIIEEDGFEVMQYTGLKDKNGREIYEGDFIQNDSTIGEVEWVQEHCAFMAFTRNPSFYRHLESDGQLNLTEVIGNIYENPQLLEV